MKHDPKLLQTLRLDQFLAQHDWRRDQELERLREENARLKFILQTEQKTKAASSGK